MVINEKGEYIMNKLADVGIPSIGVANVNFYMTSTGILAFIVTP